MKKILHNSSFSLIRLVLLAGVLSAIVFSNGEGISLLPFFHADSEVQTALQKSTQKKINAHVFSVHGSGSLRNLLVVKSEKNLKDFSLRPNFPQYGSIDLSLNRVVFKGHNYRPDILFASTGVLSEPSDRAPPAI